VLEELGVPFELKYVDRAVAAHKSPEYLALNPNGLIPVLVDTSFGGDGKPLVLYETAAVCMHLADTHPVDRLLPPLGTAERAQAYKWLAWLGNTLQATLILYFYPERWGDEAAAAQVKASAERRIGTLLASSMPSSPAMAGPGCWARLTASAIPTPSCSAAGPGLRRPARSLPHLGPYQARMLERPAVQRAFATEGLKPPLV
jgi:glutathione S-transferase